MESFLANADQHQYHRRKIKVSESYVERIWKRRMTDYSAQLNIKGKGNNTGQQNIQVGDLVWLFEENVRPIHSKIGTRLGVFRSSRLTLADSELIR